MRGSTIGMTPQFRAALDALTPQARAEVYGAAQKVMDGHPSVHLHKLEASGFTAFGVNRNALRVVCERDADTLVLLHVGPHDDAYEWARRHRMVQLGDVIRFVSIPTEEERAAEAAEPARKGPLADIRDRTFARFGIGPRASEVLRAISTEDALLEVLEQLQPRVARAVMGLATDPDDLTGLVRAFEQAAQAPPPEVSLADAVRASANASAVWMPPADRPLEVALQAGVEDWQLFLHPSQAALVRRRTTGAFQLTGGPGTGKTVVALHRAAFLAEEGRSVLLTTFSRSLAEQLEDRIGRLSAGVEVRTLVAVAQEILRRADRPHELVVDTGPLWDAALALDELGWTRRTYESEREHVVARSGAWTEAEYLAATRHGRASRLDRAGRRKVWKVLAAFEEALVEGGGGDAVALAREASRVVDAGEVASPWQAVVCDEVQDATAAELRLLGALARDPATGTTRPNGLFLCGDGYQRLYAAPVSLSSCGIEVRGRSRKLRLNYRTTEGIRRAAIEVVKGVPPDELAQLGEDEATPFDGYRSLRGGPTPVVEAFASEEAEATWIAEQAAAGALLVLARTNAYRDALAERLRAHGSAVHVLEGRGQVARDGITVCTLHRSKGLEAPRVVVAGAQLVPLRFPGGDASDRALFERQEKCLLYVGMTRARDWCAITRVRA